MEYRDLRGPLWGEIYRESASDDIWPVSVENAPPWDCQWVKQTLVAWKVVTLLSERIRKPKQARIYINEMGVPETLDKARDVWLCGMVARRDSLGETRHPKARPNVQIRNNYLLTEPHISRFENRAFTIWCFTKTTHDGGGTTRSLGKPWGLKSTHSRHSIFPGET
jgi:hypothetical protein